MSTRDALSTADRPVDQATVLPITAGTPAQPAISFITQGSDEEFAVILGRVLAGMADNPAYPDPKPTLAELAAAYDSYVDAINANDRGKLAIAARDKARSHVEPLARELSLYVAQHCRGDMVTLLGSGFPARRPRTAPQQSAPPTPGVIKVRPGPSSGQLVGRCKRVPGALVYQWRFATVQDPTAWTMTDTCSNTRVTLKDLVPGTQYLVQVRASGRRGSSDWSDSVAVFAV